MNFSIKSNSDSYMIGFTLIFHIIWTNKKTVFHVTKDVKANILHRLRIV